MTTYDGGIVFDGRIQTRSYDGQDGQKRYVTEVVADNVQFLDSRSAAGNQSEPSPTPYDFGDQPTPTTTDISSDPFADFGDSVSIDDSFLD